jgi:hypothetical protein
MCARVRVYIYTHAHTHPPSLPPSQVFRHAIDIARRDSSPRVLLRHIELAIKEIFSSALLPTIKGLAQQEAAVLVGVCVDLRNLHADETVAEAAYVR